MVDSNYMKINGWKDIKKKNYSPEYGKIGCFYQHFIQEINHLGVENNLVDESCQFPVIFEMQSWAIWCGVGLKAEPVQADASEVKCCTFLWRLLIVGEMFQFRKEKWILSWSIVDIIKIVQSKYSKTL